MRLGTRSVFSLKSNNSLCETKKKKQHNRLFETRKQRRKTFANWQLCSLYVYMKQIFTSSFNFLHNQKNKNINKKRMFHFYIKNHLKRNYKKKKNPFDFSYNSGKSRDGIKL
jgi:hypothetical protein